MLRTGQPLFHKFIAMFNMQFNPFFSLYFAKHKKSLMGIEEEWINKPKVLHAKNYVNLHKNILKKHPPGHDYCTQYFSTLSSLFCLHMTNIFIRLFIRFVVLCCAKSDCFKAHARFQVVTQLVSLHQCCISAIMCNLFRIPLKLF